MTGGSPHEPPSQLDNFTGLAEGYARHRPTYAPQALEAIFAGLQPPIRAASIGCGTGICCRLLAGHGASVIGIDPNDDMLAEARRIGADDDRITFRRGTAEQTGLDDVSCDLILCAQAFHWFDLAPTLVEFHRVLRPGGRLALMWNVRDGDDPFTRTYNDIARRAQAHAEASGRVVRRNRSGDPAETGLFEIIRRFSFPNPQVIDQSGLLGRARSASYFPRAGALKEELERALRAAFAGHQRNGCIVIQLNTELTLARRVE